MDPGSEQPTDETQSAVIYMDFQDLPLITPHPGSSGDLESFLEEALTLAASEDWR